MKLYSKNLSQQAWQMTSGILHAIKNHPFNQELMRGTLSQKKFSYYIEQDTIYLHDFARALAMIAAKSPLEYVRSFLRYSDSVFIAEQEVVHQFFREKFNSSKQAFKTPATLNYTSYLLRMCALESVEVAIAAILPCFWIYGEVGSFILKYSDEKNPYRRWIETYSSEEFNTSVKEVIAIFDCLSEEVSELQRSKMLEAFYHCACLEWHFWNDAYEEVRLDHHLFSLKAS